MILPDVLEVGLRIVFCGTAVGERSAKRGCYYAGPGNQFWPTLKKFGFVPEVFRPEDFRKLSTHGLGLTDLVKLRSVNDAELRTENFDVDGFRAKIVSFTPKALAFNGKKAAAVFLGRPVEYGLQEEGVGDTLIFVLPSTSGAARGFWDESYWMKLAEFNAEAAR
ncbi:MAG TPA: mismatch-specific DNA-glycosylase [Patescibacteria group bacterium]|nr:mismatch-specific DNA-glycosylase [Patescibacteria group bacterium]